MLTNPLLTGNIICKSNPKVTGVTPNSLHNFKAFNKDLLRNGLFATMLGFQILKQELHKHLIFIKIKIVILIDIGSNPKLLQFIVMFCS